MAACATAWSPNQIVIEVPAGTGGGPIEVTASNNERDATGDARGPLIPDFKVNDIARPGICAAEPSRARPGEAFAAVGQSFGVVPGSSVLTLGARGAVPTRWSDARIESQVPVLS